MIFDIFNKKKPIEIKAPISGKTIGLEKVKDEVFAQKMLGDGIAIEPAEGIVVAPFAGKVSQVFPTGHAIVVETKGLSLLIHIGLDTVNLKGQGFKIIAQEGQRIKVGDKLIEFDMEFIEKEGYLLQSPIVFPEGENIKTIEFAKTGEIIRSQDTIMKVCLNN